MKIICMHKTYGKYLISKIFVNILICIFENFRDKCIEIYQLNPAHFLSAPGLAWQA